MLAKAEAVTLADLSENNERSDRTPNDSTTTINRTRTTVAVERLWADTKAIHIWDWDFFDKLFRAWWNVRSPIAHGSHLDAGFAAEHSISLAQFVNGWLERDTATRRMIHAAQQVDISKDSEVCDRLWRKMDSANSGSGMCPSLDASCAYSSATTNTYFAVAFSSPVRRQEPNR